MPSIDNKTWSMCPSFLPVTVWPLKTKLDFASDLKAATRASTGRLVALSPCPSRGVSNATSGASAGGALAPPDGATREILNRPIKAMISNVITPARRGVELELEVVFIFVFSLCLHLPHNCYFVVMRQNGNLGTELCFLLTSGAESENITRKRKDTEKERHGDGEKPAGTRLYGSAA